ncbi:uncharacterized protein [Acropora muricata]|uniref:uncharacterized protein n=1 Tax=Acropora muricata TaxID=159855 RepID=UPI0034E37996
MHSVRYLSYHQWKESKGDTNKSPTYHQKLLANVENLETNVGAIDKLITGYLDATKAFCGAGSQLAEAFSTVLKETPLLEISQQLKQVVEEIDHVAHKSSVHITSQILGTLCEFTATLPGLKRAIEAHKRSAQNYESCQENLEVLEKDDSAVNSDSMRLKTTRQRFRAATEELVTEEEKLYRSFSEVEENRVKLLGSCFLSLLQVQAQFLLSSADLTSSLGGFHEIGDYLRDREVTLALKDATATWISLAQSNQALRHGYVLSREQLQVLMQIGQGELTDPDRKELIQKVNILLKNYKKEFERAPTPEADIPAGFHRNPRGIELALKGCCSEMEAMAAGGVTEVSTAQAMEQQILKFIPKLQLKIGYVMTEMCSSPSKANDYFKSKMHCIRELVSSVAKQNDIPLNCETLDMFVLMVLYEACSPVSSSAAKTAVQLLFGRAHLVTVKPSKEKNTRLARVYVKGTSVHVEVSNSWLIAEDTSTFSCLLKDLDMASPLGTVDSLYTSKFSLMDYLEDKERPLPAIHIKRRDLSKPPVSLSKLETSQCSKHKSFRKTFTKATSRIFSRKMGTAKANNLPNAGIDAGNQVAVSGAGTRNELIGNHTSVASSTDTGDDHDTDIEDPLPLPPPRPRHWAKRAKEQSMMPDCNSSSTVKPDNEHSKTDNASDWSRSIPQFPLPTFKSTMQSCQSELSLASQEELTEVINFLSGAPIKRRLLNDDDSNRSVAESHMTPIDSGLGSIYSGALSSVTQGSVAPVLVESKTNDKTKQPENMSETKISSSSHNLDLVLDCTDNEMSQNREKTKMVSMETQTSPTTEVCPVVIDKPTNGNGQKRDQRQDSGEKNKRNNQASSKVGRKYKNKKDKNVDANTESKERTASLQSASRQQKKESSPVNIVKINAPVTSPTPTSSAQDVKQVEAMKKISPTHVTVSSDKSDDSKTLSISRSLRSVWENASPPADGFDVLSSKEGSPLRKKDIHGSQDTLYHSCWSLSDFPGNSNNGDDEKEDAKSLNESMLPSNSSTGLLDLGLKWPSYGNGVHGNPVWANIPSMSDSNWSQSQEALSESASGRGKSVFSLGLGITGPDMLAAARGGSCDTVHKERMSFMPNVGKPWSTENLAQTTPWPTHDSSPPLLWSKAASLTEETFRPQQHQHTLPSQHFSDPFLPRENYWLQGRGPTAASAYLHPSHARFNSNLQRQRAFDNVQSHGMLGNLPRGHSTTSIQPSFHPGIAGYGKQSQPVPQSHLQVPGHFVIGHGSHHNSNPRF